MITFHKWHTVKFIDQSLMEVARDFQKSALIQFDESGHSELQVSHQVALAHLSLEGTRLTELAELHQ